MGEGRRVGDRMEAPWGGHKVEAVRCKEWGKEAKGT